MTRGTAGHEAVSLIGDGTYPVRTKLPSIADLLLELGVPGLNTTRDTQQLLVREGLLRTKHGLGAWVLDRQSPMAEMADVLNGFAQRGLSWSVPTSILRHRWADERTGSAPRPSNLGQVPGPPDRSVSRRRWGSATLLASYFGRSARRQTDPFHQWPLCQPGPGFAHDRSI